MTSLVSMTVAIGCVLAASADAQDQERWKGYNKGIKWEKSLEAAKARAMRESKPVLLHQLVGDMDRQGC